MFNTYEEKLRFLKLANDIKDILSPYAKINGNHIFSQKEIINPSQFKEFYRMYRFACKAMSFGKTIDDLMNYMFDSIDRNGNTFIDFNKVENIVFNNNKNSNKKVVK